MYCIVLSLLLVVYEKVEGYLSGYLMEYLFEYFIKYLLGDYMEYYVSDGKGDSVGYKCL